MCRFRRDPDPDPLLSWRALHGVGEQVVEHCCNCDTVGPDERRWHVGLETDGDLLLICHTPMMVAGPLHKGR
jgi:hypothetical protein